MKKRMIIPYSSLVSPFCTMASGTYAGRVLHATYTPEGATFSVRVGEVTIPIEFRPNAVRPEVLRKLVGRPARLIVGHMPDEQGRTCYFIRYVAVDIVSHCESMKNEQEEVQ